MSLINSNINTTSGSTLGSTSNSTTCLYYILPAEMVLHIWSFIPNETRVWLTKEYYEKYHKECILPLLKPRFDTYIRYIIRKKHEYLIKIQLKDNYDMWIKKYNWEYKNYIHTTYIHYLLYLCRNYNSNKIYNIIKNYKKNNSLKLNKSIKGKYNKWTN